jgi:hypothetical protein
VSDTDTAYTDLGIPVGAPGPPPDPTQGLPPWAMATLAQQAYYEPQQGVWPDPNAAPKQLPNVGAPLIGGGGQFSPGVPGVNRAADVMGNVANQMLIPQSPLDWGLQLSGAKALSLPYRIGALATGATLDPSEAEAGKGGLIKGIGKTIGDMAGVGAPQPAMGDLFHPISGVKLRQPLSELQTNRAIFDPMASPEKLISPQDLVGKVLIPTIGDTSASGAMVTHIGDFKLPYWVGLHGGHGYMSKGGADIWASNPGPATALADRVRVAAQETGREPVLVYSAMNPQGVDFSKQVADPLSQIYSAEKLSKPTAAEFDRLMRGPRDRFPATPDFPGVRSDNLREWLLNDAIGTTRAKFAKLADLAKFQQEGVPTAAEVRHAVSDPRLLNVPLGGSGLSLARADPRGLTMPTLHPDYPSGIVGAPGGGYMGGFGMSLPSESVFPKTAAAYREKAPTARFDYLAQRGTSPKYEIADPEWLDTIMPHWQRGPQ